MPEWVRLGRGEAGLLDAVELTEAERWLGQDSAAELGYSDELIALARQSRTSLLQKEQAARAAQEHELAQARELAESKARSARQLARRNRVLASALVLALVTAAIAGFFVRQTDIARRAADASAANARVSADARATQVVLRTTAEAIAVTREADARAAADARATEVVKRTGAEAVAVTREAEARAQAGRAALAARRAKAGELAAGAQLELQNPIYDPSLALLLAGEAVRQTWPADGYVAPQADSALQNAIARAAPLGWRMTLHRAGSCGRFARF